MKEHNKCDLHRHMGGSISPSTVVEIARRSGLDITPQTAESRMICRSHNIGFRAFLDKFTLLDEIPWPDWAIELAVEQICADLGEEHIRYCEISLSISKYIWANGWSPPDILNFIGDAFEHYSAKHNTQVGLLLALRYDSNRARQQEQAALIKHPTLRARLCGIDLIGDEDRFDAAFYKPIFTEWKFNRKTLRAHVGEMPGTGQNVRSAIELGANRIAHGIQADEGTYKLAADKGVCFDLALHSNLVTGAVLDIEQHPITRMLENGCQVTLNTDDPVQFNCTLDMEFELATAAGLLDENQAAQLSQNAWSASHHNRNSQ